MAHIDDVLRRYAEDLQFRTLVDTDPASALREYPLTPDELARLEDTVRSSQPAGDPIGPGGASDADLSARANPALTRSRSSANAASAVTATRTFGLIAITVIAAGGFALGASGAVADPRDEIDLARDAVPTYACPTGEPDQSSPPVVGELHRSDRVLVVGRSTVGGWLAVRDPGDLGGEPIWVKAPHLVPDDDVDSVPVRSCEESQDPDQPATTDGTTTSTTAAPGGSSTTSTTARSGATTTTTPGQGPGPTSPGTQPPDTTTPPDTTGPKVTVSPERSFVYTVGSQEPSCEEKSELEVQVTATDPSAPVTIGSVTFRYTGRDGSTKTGTATSLGGGRYRIGNLYDQAPLQGSTPLTITATATDGRGNPGSGSTQVALKAFGDDCIG